MKKPMIIILAVLVIALAGGGFFMYKSMSQKAPPEPVVAMYSPGESFVTNIKDSKSLLKTTIVLELNQEGKEEFLKSKNDIIRDSIIFVLREKTEDQLRASGAQDELKNEIVAGIKEKLGIDYLQTIYFDDYVLQ